MRHTQSDKKKAGGLGNQRGVADLKSRILNNPLAIPHLTKSKDMSKRLHAACHSAAKSTCHGWSMSKGDEERLRANAQTSEKNVPKKTEFGVNRP